MPKMLIVDDEPLVRESLTRYFSRRGYEVTAVGDGEQALTALRRENPQVMLLDMRMPGMDGLEVLAALRSAGKAPAVIMVTCNQDEELARRAMRLGANDYVTKPIDLAYLEDSVLAHGMLSP